MSAQLLLLTRRKQRLVQLGCTAAHGQLGLPRDRRLGPCDQLLSMRVAIRATVDLDRHLRRCHEP
jgi:hypothetical protein